jgi:4-diphosphocytidyl-2-C-methyl-D-erythritol kinase
VDVSSAGLALRCPAKINLWLRVLGRRRDGYHEIETVLHTVDLSDMLRLKRHEGHIALRCNVGGLSGRENLVWRAADLLRREPARDRGVSIVLRKRIPIAAGLGGGSSDAAAALCGLNRVWSLGLRERELEAYGARLGSDIPFFVRGGCALARGRGELLMPLRSLRTAWVVIVNPLFGLSAGQVYGLLPAGLTTSRTSDTIARRIFEAGDLEEIAARCVNDLEQGLFPRYPLLRLLKQELVNAGAVGASLSGSGPSVFGLFRTRETAQEGARSVSGPGRAVFVCRTTGPAEHSGVVQLAGQQPLEL